MPAKYRLSSESEADIVVGYQWYEGKREGLGEEFLESLEQAKEAIISSPTTFRIRYKKVRGFVVKR